MIDDEKNFYKELLNRRLRKKNECNLIMSSADMLRVAGYIPKKLYNKIMEEQENIIEELDKEWCWHD